MMKLLSCRYNMDANRVEAQFEDGTTLSIDCIAIALQILRCAYRPVLPNFRGCNTSGSPSTEHSTLLLHEVQWNNWAAARYKE